MDSILDFNYCQLLSGIDSLYLTGTYNQLNQRVFSDLSKLKDTAKKNKHPEKIEIDGITCLVQSYGAKYYQFVIQSQYFTLLISPFNDNPKMPPLNVQVRSYSLWLLGLDETIKILEKFLRRLGLLGCYDWKPSRVDLCLDIESDDFFKSGFEKYVKKRTRQEQKVKSGKKTLYIRYGKGDLSLRIYNKVEEILNSQKLWFYDLWDRSPGDYMQEKSVYRFEYQVRRKALKEFGINTLDQLKENEGSLWGYLTDWFKLVHKQAGGHKEREKLLTVWEGFKTDYKAHIKTELVRDKKAEDFEAVNIGKAAVGMTIKFAAYYCDDLQGGKSVQNFGKKELMEVFEAMIDRIGISDAGINDKFWEKSII